MNPITGPIGRDLRLADKMNLLTPDELHELTDCARKGDQIEWLRKRGWVFDIGETGRPKVDRAEYERHMIGGKKSPQKKGPDTSWYGSQTTSRP